MNHRKDRSVVTASTAFLATCVAFVFLYFVTILLLKFILYENGSFFNNVVLFVSVFCTRYYLFVIDKPLRTHEIVCLFLFILYDINLLDFFNMFLLLGVECIRQQMHRSPPLKEMGTFVIGMVFLHIGWISVGKVLVIYHYSMILLLSIMMLV